MRGVRNRPIFARKQPEEFIGRVDELERLHAYSKAAGSGGLFLLAQPAAGATELLCQTFDRLFLEQGETLPIYFSFDRRDRNMGRAAHRFANELVTQAVAFCLNDAPLCNASPGTEELSRLAPARDSAWLDPLIECVSSLEQTQEQQAFVKQAFALPQRVASFGNQIFVMLDSMHELLYLAESEGFVETLKREWSNAQFQYVFSAHRRYLGVDFELTRMMLERPGDSDACVIAENSARGHGVEVNEETRDLIVTQLQNHPGNIEAVIRRATLEEISLDGFSNIQRSYSDEIFAGGIGAYFDGVVAAATPTHAAAQNLIALLYDTVERDVPLLPVEKWRRRIGLDEGPFERLLRTLNVEELIRVTSNRVEVMRESMPWVDYIRGRQRLEINGESRATVIADELAEYTRRAPELMARRYRRASALDLRGLMSRFERRAVPLALLDYVAFKEKYKGLSAVEIEAGLQADSETILLPGIVFTASTESFYPQLREHIDAERSSVGIGFQTGSYNAEDEVVWLAAEIESKLEVERETAEFWCDRLEAAALMCDFPHYKIWLIATEGFTREAMDAISQRKGFGSSRRQVELLSGFLAADNAENEAVLSENEYEITIPMGDDSELVAARTIEDIARKHGVTSHVINQIKTAVVEACINASEHGHSPDGQIRLSFTVADDRLNITIANRGVRITDRTPVEDQETQARRGWGLKLMERLMDDVTLEQTDDGTRIHMSKLLAAA